MILSFQTDRPGQTEQQSDLGLHCLLFHQHLLHALQNVKTTLLNFRMITAIFLVSEYLGIL